MKHITKYLGLAVAVSLIAGGAFAASYIETDFSPHDEAAVLMESARDDASEGSMLARLVSS